ncbi:hypothetical protein K4A83_07550 [Spirulina subsalsa FACHB-351]|uniref:Secreted protein n=1 Tax=Spirulina subsalsa FACHB-351 TaxID=234711 RepID=A0ABT3L3P9_9CYAN|nr:hypothetical protein [Spirulina subsalsa]MCW6036126.1 hypothetical protein [Spirulina subsalsa FACHB-351]
MKTQPLLSRLVLSGCLVILPALGVQAQEPAPLIAQSSVCQNYSPEAAAQEALLLQMINQARQQEQRQGGGLGNLQQFLTLAERFLPGALGDRVNLGQVTSILNQIMSWVGADNSLSQSAPDPEMTRVMEVVSRRLEPLLRQSRGNLDPKQVVNILMDTASEVGEVKARQPQQDSTLDYLTRELETLRRQCRSGVSPNRPTPLPAPAPIPSSGSGLPSLPPQAASRSVQLYTQACQDRGGTISSHYEGEDTGEGRLEYRQMLQCIPGARALDWADMENDCLAAGGEWLGERSGPICRF